MRNKIFSKIALSAITTLALSTSAFAEGWIHDGMGWWYSTNDANTTWHANSWQWLDGNKDGKAECYFFDPNGYILVGTTTPDGYQVDANGAWTVNGAVQSKDVAVSGAASTASASTGSTSSSSSTDTAATGVSFENFDWQLEQKHTHEGVTVEKYLGVYVFHKDGTVYDSYFDEFAILSNGTLHCSTGKTGDGEGKRINDNTFDSIRGNAQYRWVIEDDGDTIREEYYINDGKWNGIDLDKSEDGSPRRYFTRIS